MVRNATESDTRFVKELWSVCFNDSEKFVNWNFDKNYSCKNTIIAEINETPASAAQYIPYQLSVLGQSVPIGFVSGVSTLPQYRNNGLVRQILPFGLNRLYKSGAYFSLLVPAVFGLYEKFGYSTVCQRISYPDSVAEGVVVRNMCDTLVDLLADIYKKEHADNSIFIARSKHNFELILDELFNISGGYIILDNLKQPSAYAIVHGNGEVCEICGKLLLNTSGKTETPLMARIVNADKVLRLLAPILKNGTIFDISDDIIPENNICVMIDGKEIVPCKPDGKKTNITELCELLFKKLGEIKNGCDINFVLEI